jgi:cytochrome c553
LSVLARRYRLFHKGYAIKVIVIYIIWTTQFFRCHFNLYTPRSRKTAKRVSRAMRYLLVTILALSASAFAQTDEQRAAIADRIKSFSNVCVAGQDCGGASVADQAVAALSGEAKYVGCAACHGPNGGGGIGPALAGQDADYIVGRLNAYRANETVGAQSALMWGQAAALSDDDIQDLADYVTSF